MALAIICLFMQTQFQLGNYVYLHMHAQMNTQSLANLQDLIPRHDNRQHKLTYIGIKCCRFARECISFVLAYVDAIQKHLGCKKGEAKSEAPVNVKITSESTGD